MTATTPEHLYQHHGAPWADLAAFVPNVGDRRMVEFGTFGMPDGRAARRYVELRNVGALIECSIFGALIAEVRQDSVTLWARGYGHANTTREALSAVTFGRGFVHSFERQLYAGGELFREGITFGWDDDGRPVLLSPGQGEPVEGARPRRQR